MPLPLTESGKPILEVRLSGEGAGSLPARDALNNLKPSSSNHEHLSLRHPLGIYNISCHLVIKRLNKLANLLIDLFRNMDRVEKHKTNQALIDDIFDYLELTLHAAAEHVDDVKLIAKCFSHLDHNGDCQKKLMKAFKLNRDKITKIINTIKHSNGRLRHYAIDFEHAKHQMCLHGFCVEGFVVADGAIGPSPVVHGEGETVFSLTSFVWMIIVYMGTASKLVEDYLICCNAVEQPENYLAERDNDFASALTTIACLPNYHFDDMHPFTETRLVVVGNLDPISDQALTPIYGSFFSPWAKSLEAVIERQHYVMSGDGISCKFNLPTPSRISIQHNE